jgi:GNAT superfamily N-acetyltransferase
VQLVEEREAREYFRRFSPLIGTLSSPAVSRLEIGAFVEDHLEAAGSLLAARHRAHRAAEPLLSQRFEDADATRGEVAALWADEHASGAVALRDGQVVGFLLGTRRDDRKWGANIWVEAAGYAVDEPEVVRDLYAYASQRWVDQGRTRHYALVPKLDEQVNAWFRLSFGAQQAHGIKEVDDQMWPPGTRRAEHGDTEALIELMPLVSRHHVLAPTFSGIEADENEDALRAMLAEEISNDELGELVYERDGRVVASFEILPAENVSMHRGLARPDRAACLGWAASLPDVRGSGAGLALTGAAFAWAHERGYAAMVTDWRETNLLSSRFWPARGFRRSFLRLYRSIP